jgi:hypothetical protein
MSAVIDQPVVEPWDQLDPVANAILALVGAQNAVTRTITATCEERHDGSFASDAEVEAAFDARTHALLELLAAQEVHWRLERSLWREAALRRALERR